MPTWVVKWVGHPGRGSEQTKADGSADALCPHGATEGEAGVSTEMVQELLLLRIRHVYWSFVIFAGHYGIQKDFLKRGFVWSLTGFFEEGNLFLKE